jgi:uncharacterized protein YdaU (DUF1376 family)
MNYYPHHIGDFRAGTVNMTRQERWIYRDMLDVYYDTEQPLSLNIEKVCHDVGVRTEDEQAIVRTLLRFKFIQSEDGYRHERCDLEIAAYQTRADTAKENGKRGGRPKKAQNKTQKNPAGFDPVAAGARVDTGSEANQEPRTKNQEENPKTFVPADGGDGGLFDDAPLLDMGETALPDPVHSPIIVPRDAVRQVFGHWQDVMQSPRSKLDAKRETAIRRALTQFTPEELCKAINGCAVTPHNMGLNERSEKYNDIELICRNAGNVERFMRNADSPPRTDGARPSINDFGTPANADDPFDLMRQA